MPYEPSDPLAASVKSKASDSVPPPPVVSDWEASDSGHSLAAQAQTLLARACGPDWRTRFFRARVALLLTVLAGVMVWAGTDHYQRRARTAWHRPLNVALVLVERDRIRPSTLGLLTTRARELEKRLAREYQRHDGREFAPFAFDVLGPVQADRAPPHFREQSWLQLLLDTFERWRWTRDIDARANVAKSPHDARIYLVMKPAHGGLAFVEGESEYGGRVGVAQVDIDPEMVDFALFVATHELMHTLGASDKYDAQGSALFPGGFAEPNKLPLYPQPGAEVMARNRPLAAGTERPPSSLDELFVGDETAREIGWRRP